MTLTEFLLARVVEDEAWIGRRGDDLDHCQECAFGQQPDSPYSKARVLAECEAKRRIVTETGWVTVQRLLALPYADHPDYQDEWRL